MEKRKRELSKREKFLRITIVLLAFVGLVVGAYITLQLTGLFSYIDSKEKIVSLINRAGIWAVGVFILLQILQVTFLPIPAAVTTIAGALVFGPHLAVLYSLIGIWAGSVLAFALGRLFGVKICRFMIGKENTEKWSRKLEKGKYIFFLMMLFPFFPDDILCIVAGMTAMSWRFFLLTNLITRPVAVLVLCYFGSGTIIPFEGWGFIVWPILIVLFLILFYFSYRHSVKIEKFILSLGTSHKKKMNEESQDEPLESFPEELAEEQIDFPRGEEDLSVKEELLVNSQEENSQDEKVKEDFTHKKRKHKKRSQKD